MDLNTYFQYKLLESFHRKSETVKLKKKIKKYLKDSFQSERDTIVSKLTNQPPTSKKYGPSSTGAETASGRIRTSLSTRRHKVVHD